MADQIINIPGVGDVAFPDSMSEDEISAAAGRLYQSAGADQDRPSDIGPASGAAAARPVLRTVGRTAGAVAGSPLAQKAIATGLQSGVGGMVGGPIGLLARVPGMERGVGLAAKGLSALGRVGSGSLFGPLAALLDQTGDRSMGNESTADRQSRFEEMYRQRLLQKLGSGHELPDIHLPE